MADATAALSARSKVQAFLEAARAGDLDSLKKLAAALDEEGKGVAAVAAAVKDANKRTALHFAAREGRTHVCHFLISDLALPVDPKDDDAQLNLTSIQFQVQVQGSRCEWRWGNYFMLSITIVPRKMPPKFFLLGTLLLLY
ncbi:hypothetical protein OsI_18099 [Oryza sativa Indica Group]|uniref:Uncharacterized protein n=1 Tax=Oryza sativa subsp. indica TaxID=39946 RepID=B8AWK0_ORYSI|nr:hypothetical protein OsI_18099 [Oryza sativa Indica Group]